MANQHVMPIQKEHEAPIINNKFPKLNQLYVYLTDGCNLACRHCWLQPKFDPTGQSATMLSLETLDSVINQALPLGLSVVKLTGGEPLLHPQFERILENVYQSGVKLHIETNGVLCTRNTAAQIATSNASFVSVSLDGSDTDTHEAIRGIQGSFIKTVRGIENLVAENIRPQLIMSLFKKNADQLSDMVSLAERLGASSLKFNVIQPSGRGKSLDAEGQLLGIAELIDLGHYVDKELSLSTELPLYLDTPPAFRSLQRIYHDDGCGACNMHSILGLLPSGEYALCGIGHQIPELVFGSANKDPLRKVWEESIVLQSLRQNLPNRLEGVCASCLMKKECLGFCIAENYCHNGSLWSPFWFCSQAYRLGLFPSSRLLSKPEA